MSFGDFDIFNVRYIIEFELDTKSPVAIRSGKSFVGPIDNPVIRIRRREGDTPYIPGSSIKGVLRNEAEKILRSRGEDVCDILNPESENGELGRKEREKDSYKPCIICQIFGGPTIASHIYFYDAYPIEGLYSLGVIKRVSINRITAAQMPGKLFDIEYINPGSKFKGRIVIENIDILSDSDKRSTIFNEVFKMFYRGHLPIGGMKSVGMGYLEVNKIKVTKLYIKEGEFIEEDVTREYLNKLEGD